MTTDRDVCYGDNEKCTLCHGTGRSPHWGFLGRVLRARRRALGLSLREVARDADMSPAHLSDMELGRRSMGGPKAERVLSRFDLHVLNAFGAPLGRWGWVSEQDLDGAILGES
uniref:Putative DNA binding, helix-turn-helix domain containing protein n=1 Tax=viral metagenome TaxID=1070528 RepID=A0A6H2A1V0_9ZZZZ